MNILPKKRWHVRTKENIARVRRDEAQAAEEEKEKERRANLGEQEARLSLLRKNAGHHIDESIEKPSPSEKLEHINFFKDLEEGIDSYSGVNKEHEQEKKEEKEKYEKQIGYLTYLGQNTVEATGQVSWYNKIPERSSSSNCGPSLETSVKSKQLIDPLNDVRRALNMTKDELKLETKRSDSVSLQSHSRNSSAFGNEDSNRYKQKSLKKKKKHRKKRKKRRKASDTDDSSSNRDDSESEYSETDDRQNSVNLDELRAERLKREEKEKLRAAQVLAKLRGETVPEPKPVIQQKYNSQFNPHIAKQNFN